MIETPPTSPRGISVLLLCGAMYPAATLELVAAVSEAGGLGIVQPIFVTYVHGHEFREGLRLIRRLTSKPIGLNAPIEQSSKAYHERMARWIDVALEEVRFFVTRSATRAGWWTGCGAWGGGVPRRDRSGAGPREGAHRGEGAGQGHWSPRSCWPRAGSAPAAAGGDVAGFAVILRIGQRLDPSSPRPSAAPATLQAGSACRWRWTASGTRRASRRSWPCYAYIERTCFIAWPECRASESYKQASRHRRTRVLTDASPSTRSAPHPVHRARPTARVRWRAGRLLAGGQHLMRTIYAPRSPRRDIVRESTTGGDD